MGEKKIFIFHFTALPRIIPIWYFWGEGRKNQKILTYPKCLSHHLPLCLKFATYGSSHPLTYFYINYFKERIMDVAKI